MSYVIRVGNGLLSSVLTDEQEKIDTFSVVKWETAPNNLDDIIVYSTKNTALRRADEIRTMLGLALDLREVVEVLQVEVKFEFAKIEGSKTK